MQCPKCNGKLRSLQERGISVDRCPKCGGVWLDSGELRDYVNDILRKGEDVPEPDPAPNLKRLMLPTDTDFLCPRCQGRLRTTNYNYNSNIMVEKCPSCDGLWLDHGKLILLAGYIKNAADMRDLIKKQVEAQEEAEREMARQPEESNGVGAVLVSLATIPTGDDAVCTHTPWCTAGFIVLNVLVFLYEAYVTPDAHALVQGYGLIPSVLMHGANLTSLATHMFLHSSAAHLGGNMVYLYVFGDNIEDELGRTRFVLFYLFSGLVAALVHVLVYRTADVPMIGASGAVAGILGAYLVLYPNAHVTVVGRGQSYALRADVYIGAWFVFQGFLAYVDVSTGHAHGVARFAHLGGFVAGAALALAHRFRRRSRQQVPA